MPPRKKRGRHKQIISENRIIEFCKNEIVWVKMKFHPPWPAKLKTPFTLNTKDYEKK
jgi:hypothetical protein